jgi:hypothetical protein
LIRLLQGTTTTTQVDEMVIRRDYNDGCRVCHPDLKKRRNGRLVLYLRDDGKPNSLHWEDSTRTYQAISSPPPSSLCSRVQLLLSAPCAIIAQNYKLLNLLSLYLQADDCLLIRRKWSMPLFLTSDAITFLAQLAGTGMIASTIEDIMEYGRYVTLGGLIVQAVSLATFITSWLTFRRRL